MKKSFHITGFRTDILRFEIRVSRIQNRRTHQHPPIFGKALLGIRCQYKLEDSFHGKILYLISFIPSFLTVTVFLDFVHRPEF
jgi:hypothetical protein